MKVRTQARRDAIVDAAAELFEEAGYEGASMNELARRIGGSKATLYGYFPSKEELFVAVVRAFATAHLGEATADLVSALEERPAFGPFLHRVGYKVLQVMLNDRRALAVYRMVIAEAGRSDAGELFHDTGPRQCMEALTRFMAAAIQHGDMRKADPAVAAMQFMALLTAETGARLYQQNPPRLAAAEINQRVARAVDFFLLGAGHAAKPARTQRPEQVPSDG